MAVTGYLIEKYNCMLNAYTCNRLTEEAGKLGMDLRIIGIHDTMVTGRGIENNGCILEQRDFVINRYKWGKEKDLINGLGRRTYNNIDKYNLYINKYEQIKRLHSSAFIVPEYILGTSLLPYETITSRLGSPFVCKGLESSMGKEVFLINSREQYAQLRTEYGEAKEWLFEEFIEESAGRDLRFFSIRGDAAACMQRKSKGDFRANAALGAVLEPCEITPEIRKTAEDLYEQTGLDFLGIDLLFGKEKPYFCEINVMPGIEGIEKTSGVNIARRIMETIKDDFSDE